MDLLEWLKVLAPFVMLVVSTLLSVIAWLGKRVLDGYGEQIGKMRTEHDDLEKEFLKFQAHLPRVYVLKDDHIRHITIVEKKIDDLSVGVHASLAALNSDVKLLLRETPKGRTHGTS